MDSDEVGTGDQDKRDWKIKETVCMQAKEMTEKDIINTSFTINDDGDVKFDLTEQDFSPLLVTVYGGIISWEHWLTVVKKLQYLRTAFAGEIK